jgi:hypothetical protein
MRIYFKKSVHFPIWFDVIIPLKTKYHTSYDGHEELYKMYDIVEVLVKEFPGLIYDIKGDYCEVYGKRYVGPSLRVCLKSKSDQAFFIMATNTGIEI